MTTEPSELLNRISSTLRNEVGPAVEGEYTRTQTYMASVILSKLAKQVALGPTHAEAERSDIGELHQQLAKVLKDAPTEVAAEAERAAVAGTVPALSPLIETVYQWGLDNQGAEMALALIRKTLRKDIDRRMEIAT